MTVELPTVSYNLTLYSDSQDRKKLEYCFIFDTNKWGDSRYVTNGHIKRGYKRTPNLHNVVP